MQTEGRLQTGGEWLLVLLLSGNGINKKLKTGYTVESTVTGTSILISADAFL